MTADDADLARQVADLAARVRRLEEREGTSPPARPGGDLALARDLLDPLAGPDSGNGMAAVVYAGAGPWGGGRVAWQLGRTWDEVLEPDGGAAARVLSAMASPTRLDILRVLVRGPLPTSELAARLDMPSAGQLFHHIRELLAAGLVHQPSRGTYAVGRRHVVPLLAALSCAQDLSSDGRAGPDDDR